MKLLKINFFFVFLFISVINIFGQTPRVRTFDAQHYIIRSSFDRKNKIFYGDVTVQVKPLTDNFNKLVLDSVGMKFQSVTLEPTGTTLDYKQTADKVTVILDKSFSQNDLVSVRFKYSSQTPKKGVYFVDEEKADGKVLHSSQVWTQGEAEEARYWFPSYDFPDDKATTEQYITIPNDEVAIANGELLEKTENSDGTTTFHYKMPVVHSVYLTSFVVGKYVKVEGKYKNIPLGYYVYPGKENIVEKAYGKTPDMMRVYEELTGIDFPYNKYDQTIVARFNFGGMENITATTMADTEIMFGLFSPDIAVDLVSHELAHSWFGDLVTTKDWSNLWLNEGFATFMEAAYREKSNGRADYLRKVREDAAQYMAEDSYSNSRHPLMRPNPPTDDSLFDTTTYQKGGAVIHTLREEVGTENFWKAINIYLNRHKFDNVVTEDLKRAMQEVSGKDLSWFFDQWVYKAGFPKLIITQVYNQTKKRLTLNITQSQKIDSITPSAFILPMELEIQTAKGTKTEKIQINKRSQTINLQVDSKPVKVIFDKDEKIPLKNLRVIK
ncbi:MAG: M1 family metallopeptidase [Pyrinomonadaceae bacterium]|nr:M1 family metallopeptidase [Pyrinomonadaceae bacterium]